MWNIDKRYDICYAHRVHSQQLDPNYSMNSCHACRRLHGHNGQIHLHLQAEELEGGMVTDFNNLESFKKLLDDYLDHKFILDINDPYAGHFVPLWDQINYSNLFIEYDEGFKTIKMDQWEHAPDLLEILESFVIVDFVPTSENLCAWLHGIAEYHLKDLQGLGDRVKVKSVEFYETPKSHCEYSV